MMIQQLLDKICHLYGDTIVVWVCGTTKKKGGRCNRKDIPERVLREACAEALGLEEFDEDVFLERVDYILVGPDQKLEFHFYDGTVKVQKWESTAKKDCWTEEHKDRHGIADTLTKDGIPTPGGKKKWSISTVKSILSNEKYKGDALLQKSYTVDFLTKKTKVNEGEIPQYYVEDNHEAIIDPEVFEMVQREMAKRGKGKKYHSGVHAFSTKIKCGECGSWYGSKVWHSNSKYRKTIWQCNHKFDGDCRCQTPHLTDEEIQLHFLSAANKLLATKAAVIANGREMQALLFDTTELEAEQAQLLEETQVVSDMVQQAIQENARTAQNQTEYQKRYDGLVQRFDRAKTRLEEVTAEIQEKQTASANMGAFLSTFEQMPDALTEFTLESWHSMVDFATVYSIDDIRFTFKNGQEIQA